MPRRKTYENLIAPHLDQVKDWRRKGAKMKWIAEQFGISDTTLYKWTNENPELAETLKEAETNFHLHAKLTAENTLLGKLQDRMVITEETAEEWKDENGEVIKQHIIRRKRLVQADTTAVIFALKNLGKEQWNKEEYELALARTAKVKLETDKIEKGEDVGSVILNRLAKYSGDDGDA